MVEDVIFLDIEASFDRKIQEIGLVYENDTLKTSSVKEIETYLQHTQVKYIAGHNFIVFDKKLLEESSLIALLDEKVFIDTLPVSLLLFNEKTFHSLPKNYKSEDNFLNDPVLDAKLSKKLLIRSIEKFKTLPTLQRNILYTLLKDEELFKGFFEFIATENIFEELSYNILLGSIHNIFQTIIKNLDVLKEALELYRVELAFILAVRMPELEVNAQPPKVLYDYKNITSLQSRLCFDYEDSIEHLSVIAKDIFGFGTFREFPRQNATLETGAIISQKEIVAAALQNESFLAILPTGGGKTFTFWLPSLIKAKALKSLTVVISPLQALIKDHIESFHETVANFTAVALSGYMSPTEREEAMQKVINGDADVLYLAPESLRSNTVFNLLKNRVIERFVVDEAHCLSTWGNDFRHDYFYIASFLKDLLKHKPFQDHIPISCFTATAKPKVIEEITAYFESKLDIKMQHYIAVPERKNLDYEGYELKSEKEKYKSLLEILNEKEGSTLIYIPSSTKKCDEIAQQLATDTGKNVRSFHSKLDTDLKMKILQEYIDDTIDIVVATTAFGMGVDKPNIKNVIHYEISESLENYSQEAGRGARDQNIRASCPLLFSQDDLDKHFTTLNRSKINANEINAIFRVLKNDSRNPVSLTTREIASKAGWDTEDNSNDYDMKVKTALLELEREKYIERTRNKVHYYADSLAKNSLEILQEEYKKRDYDEEKRTRLSRVLQVLLGSGKPESVELDELTEILGYTHPQITESILILKEMKIISNAKDLSVKLFNSSLETYEKYIQIEMLIYKFLIQENSHTVRMNELNQIIVETSTLELKNENMTPVIKVLLKSWIGDKHYFKFNRLDRQKDLWYFEFLDLKKVEQIILYKHSIATKILHYLLQHFPKKNSLQKEEVAFSLEELQKALQLKEQQSVKIIDKALLHLHELHLLELGDGRFIYYAPMQIQKLEKMFIPNKRYTKEEYRARLQPYYQYKMESIHIVGAYSELLIKNSKQAQIFMRDYFTLSYQRFINKYGELKEKFKRPMTQYRYNKVFNTLSEEQKQVINDKESQAMMILAGPGSGKTKVLVHKIASLILQEDIKADQFLMLTYSRTAMLEFKSRLFALIGQLAYDIDIFTFHGFALQLIGRRANNDKDEILKDAVAIAVKQIKDGKVQVPFQTVIVLDEYQDINSDGFALIQALVNTHENKKRLVAVGDDDQCILKDVNGANIEFIKEYEKEFGVDENDENSYATYELLTNFRSAQNIVTYSNQFISKLSQRYKQHPLSAHSSIQGDVKVVTCNSTYLQIPAVEEVKKYLESNSTLAVLAHTNDEVSDIYALLHNNNIDATYLLDIHGLKLRNLVEIEFLDQLVKDKEFSEQLLWDCYEKVKERFSGSKNLSLVGKIIKGFTDTHELYTLSFWKIYLDEISIEQFNFQGNRVIVSTIHKSKGKEFDTVVLVAHKMKFDDDFIRLFYVGMTRAKKKLVIVTNDPQFQDNSKNIVTSVHDTQIYLEPKMKTFVMGLKDLYLSYDAYSDKHNVDLIAGSTVTIKKLKKDLPYYLLFEGYKIGRVSKEMDKKITLYESKGYIISNIYIENVVRWYDERNSCFRTLPLCKIFMEKSV